MSLPFRVIVITDWARGDLLARLDAILAVAPVFAVQHRHPGADDRRFYEEAVALRALCARHGAPLFVNGRLDVALAVDAHLHLGSRALAPADVRPALRGRWLSLAVHPLEAPADLRHVELALVSPVFPPGSKPGDVRQTLGAEGFRAFAGAAAVPCFALGGVTAARARGLGGAGVAVVSELLHADAPARAAESLLRALE